MKERWALRLEGLESKTVPFETVGAVIIYPDGAFILWSNSISSNSGSSSTLIPPSLIPPSASIAATSYVLFSVMPVASNPSKVSGTILRVRADWGVTNGLLSRILGMVCHSFTLLPNCGCVLSHMDRTHFADEIQTWQCRCPEAILPHRADHRTDGQDTQIYRLCW